jgi:osmoprotectant transport system permease protein
VKKRTLIFLTALMVFTLIASLGCSKQNGKTIQMATDTTAEESVISEMVKEIIENKTDLKVEITKGISGGTGNIHPAMVKGDFDMYPEYTGTAWMYVLKRTDLLHDNEALFNELKKEYKEKFDFEWIGLYGFNNSYGLMIQPEIAEKYNINTYSDLAKHADQLVFGAEYDFFEREDGYDGICNAYNMNFKSYVDMNFALKYDALHAKEVDVIVIFTTDGKLASADGKVLVDDLNFFPKYLCGTVIRGEVLEEYPELCEPLMLMNDLINDEEMTELNYKTEVLNLEESEVALEYLKEKKILEK